MPRIVIGWKAVLASVLVGNAVYFGLLLHLPEAWQHQPFVFDRGLALDFLLCVAFYLPFRRLWPARR